MPKCPACNAGIDHLQYVRSVIAEFTASGIVNEEVLEITYSCPVCGETLTGKYDEAVKIISGEFERELAKAKLPISKTLPGTKNNIQTRLI